MTRHDRDKTAVPRFVGAGIASRRREIGRSQEELSELVGLHPTSLGRRTKEGSAMTAMVAGTFHTPRATTRARSR